MSDESMGAGAAYAPGAVQDRPAAAGGASASLAGLGGAPDAGDTYGFPGGAHGSHAGSAYPAPGFLLDVRITVSVEVGRVQLPLKQVMEMGPGAVIELQRSASDPVEIYANGRCIGKGEIVVVGEQFGVRIV